MTGEGLGGKEGDRVVVRGKEGDRGGVRGEGRRQGRG